MISNKKLNQILVKAGKIKPSQYDFALKKAKKKKIALEQALIEDGIIPKEELGELIAKELGVPYINLSKKPIKREVLSIVPEIVAKKQLMIVFDKNKEGLMVAFNNPKDLQLQHFLTKKTGENIIPYYTTQKDILLASKLYGQGLTGDFSKVITEYLEKAKQGTKKDLPIIKIVEAVMKYAYENRTSDIHIEPYEKETIFRFRVDGILHDVLSIPREFHNMIVARIKIMADLRTDEHNSAQDGKLQIVLPEEKLDTRVSIIPIVEGEKAVLRLLSKKIRAYNLDNLGIADQDLKKVKKAIKKPWGMILATGATGSGKTTTLYAILKILNTREVNIQTIENPVEYDMERVNQIQVNPETNLTFAKGLKSILRQDPDIIMVGEIRDDETAQIAVNAAMTGHLVLSTLHTNDSATTLPRLLDMKVKPYLIASTVIIAIAQRLVRKICLECKQSYKLSRAELLKLIPEDTVNKYLKDKKEIELFRGAGCESCLNSGYMGRTGLYEILEISPTIRKLIINKATSQQIKEQAINEGMTTMLENGMEKALAGVTTLDEVLRVL